MKKRLLATIITLSIVLSVVLAGCGQNSASSGSGNTISLAFTGDPESFDSSKVAESAANTVIQETQEGLVRLGDKKIEPAGATKWEVSSDGLTWTFHLRDYTYSDGVKVKAQDFVYAVRRMFDPATACPSAGIFYCIKGGEDFLNGKGSVEDIGVKATDDNTLEITLKTPTPYFEQLANFVSILPLRQDVIEKAGVTYGTDPKAMVFSGPFVVDSWIRGSKIILKKNEKYWDAANVKLNEAVISIVPEQATQEQLFDSKGLDIIQDVKAEYVDKLKTKIDAGDIASLVGYYPSCSYVAFNNKDKDKIFTNAKIRKAFSLAIDREAYSQNVIKKDVPAYGFLPFGLNNGEKIYREAVEEPLKSMSGEDPKKLFEEGVAELGINTSTPITVTFLQRTAASNNKTISEYLQDQWQKKLGVIVKIDTAADGATFNKSIQKGEYQVAVTGWGGDYNDPMTFMELFLTGSPNNSAFFDNERYNELVNAGAVDSNADKRLDMFREAEKILVADNAGIAPLTYNVKTTYMQSYVKGILVQAGGPAWELKNAYIEKK